MQEINSKEIFQPMNFEKLREILSITIKGDDDNKLITFLCCLSAYTDSSQFNIAFNAPSSTGKSYIPIEVSSLFPDEDVVSLGHCSPTAFFHDQSDFNRSTMTSIVNLERKIIIFLDQPHFQLLSRLRPLLSHDKKQFELKVTDKSNRGGLHTKNITVIGFPSVIFCTAGLNIDEQEATRFILLSPDMTQEKIRSAICAKIKKDSDLQKFKEELDANLERRLLKQRILAIKNAFIYDVKIQNEEVVRQRFMKPGLYLRPRHMRDIGKLLVLIKASALLNLWHRPKIGKNIVATDEDIEQGFELWEKIHVYQELNLPPYVYNFYREIIKPLCGDGKVTTRKDVQQKHVEVYKCPIGDFKLRTEILPVLESAALIVQEPDSEDKRRVLIYVPSDKL